MGVLSSLVCNKVAMARSDQFFFKSAQHCAGEKKRQVAKDSSAHSLANRNLRENEREGIRAELPSFFSWVPRRAVGNDEI
jgi:hypothetical protein